jgi:hypothetical protein
MDALHDVLVYKTPCTKLRSNTIPHTPSVSGGSVIGTLNLFHHTTPHLLFPWALRTPAHCVPKDGPCGMNTRWHVSQSSGVKMKLRLSPSRFRSQRDWKTKFLRHYQDAYATLMIMFGSTAILPPRTKRWAEAKVLADAINVKVRMHALCTITLTTRPIDNQTIPVQSRALSCTFAPQLPHAPVRRFFTGMGHRRGDIRVLELDGETVRPSYPNTSNESLMMSSRHRVLAELLEQGSNSSLTFPTNSPPSLTAGVSSAGTPVDLDAVRALGLNPSHALQHPGHYYYMAARCTEARRERFLANEVCLMSRFIDPSIISHPKKGISQGTSAAPGYANEKKADHLTLILEVCALFDLCS